VVVGALVFCVTILLRTQILASQDLYLHISIGRWILANRLIPDHGIFSGSMAAAPWVAHEWLASIGSAWLYDHYGWGGILAAVAVLLALAVGALTLEIVPTLGPVGALCAAILAWGLCVNHLVARPHVAALPLLVIWLAAHVRARRGNTIPSFYLAPVMTLWANLHGSFMFGLIFTALFAAEAVFESATSKDAASAGWRWSAFLGASIVAATLTPYGLTGLLFPLRMMAIGLALDTVHEWQPSTVTNNAPVFLWSALLLFLALWRGVRLPLCRLIMLMLLLYMAFAHRRHTELLGLATPLLLQFAIAGLLPWTAPGFTSLSTAFARPAVRLSVVGLALLATGIFTFAGCRDVVRGPDSYTPAAAMAAVEAYGVSGPVLNAQNFGGYLIFRGYQPFIDGRIDLYGNEFIARYMALDQLTALLAQYRVAWTIFEPANPRTTVMDNLPGWSRLYADDAAVVHIRNDIRSH
jgi:MFS family permease